MNKEKFLNKIDENLKTIPIMERIKIVQYFNEIIDDHVEDGLTEEQAILALGDINDIVNSILETEEMKKNKINREIKVEDEKQSQNSKSDNNTNFVIINDNNNEYKNDNTNNHNNRKNKQNTYKDTTYNKTENNKSKDINFNFDVNKIFKKTEKMVEKGMRMAKKAIDETDFNFDFDFSSTKDNLISKTYDSIDDIEILHVEDINTGITILESNDKKIHVKYCENENEKYNINEQNGTLKIIKVITNKNIFKWFNYKLRNKLELYIPKDFYKDARIMTTNSTISLQNINFNKVNLKTSNGKISIKNSIIKEYLDCNNSNGPININKYVCDKNTTLKTSNGRINLVNAYGYSIDCKTSNSSINVDSSNFNNNINLTTSNSKIIFEDLKVGNNLYCKTCNSTINGTIIDDINNFTIESHTNNGKNTLPNNTKGNKIFKCYTSNGSILVDFINYSNESTNNN